MRELAAPPPLRCLRSVGEKRTGAGEEHERRRVGATRAREPGGRAVTPRGKPASCERVSCAVPNVVESARAPAKSTSGRRADSRRAGEPCGRSGSGAARGSGSLTALVPNLRQARLLSTVIGFSLRQAPVRPESRERYHCGTSFLRSSTLSIVSMLALLAWSDTWLHGRARSL
jgi:hypothetical protein